MTGVEDLFVGVDDREFPLLAAPSGVLRAVMSLSAGEAVIDRLAESAGDLERFLFFWNRYKNQIKIMKRPRKVIMCFKTF